MCLFNFFNVNILILIIMDLTDTITNFKLSKLFDIPWAKKYLTLVSTMFLRKDLEYENVEINALKGTIFIKEIIIQKFARKF